MSISRRELYALGEPLGDSATYRKADGGLVLGDGGGGGGDGGGGHRGHSLRAVAIRSASAASSSVSACRLRQTRRTIPKS